MKEKDFISNYEAIRNMSPEEMTYFLDCVYTTGINDGMYSADHEGDCDIADCCPYNRKWLDAPAEDATRYVFAEDNDEYIPDALVKSVLRAAGINSDDIPEDT